MRRLPANPNLNLLGCAWALLAALALGGAAPLGASAGAPRQAAASSQVTLDVRGGFDGFYRVGGWLPIFAIAGNEGPPVDGTLTLAGTDRDPTSGRYGALATLPTHSRKLIEFAAPAMTAERNRTLTLATGEGTVATQTLSLTPVGSQDYLYGVISPSAGALNVLMGRRQFGGTISVAHLTTADVPAFGPALADLDALVVDAPTSGLSAQQRQALEAWVSSGGQLIIAGGPSAARTLAGLADLAPVDLSGTEALDLGAALAPWGGGDATGSVVVGAGRPRSGSVVRLGAGATPLVVDRALGRGWVTFVALGAGEPALRDGDAAAALWGRVLTGSRAGSRAGNGNPQTRPLAYYPGSALTALPETSLPSPRLLALFALAYILAVGPLNYLVLRRLDRREWLWGTIPAVGLLFAAGAYVGALQVKGTQIVVNTVNVAQGTERQAGTETRSYLGIFSPGRAAYDVRLAGAGGVVPRNVSIGAPPPLTLSDGSAVLLRGVRIEQWAVQAFDASGSTPAVPPIESSLAVNGASVDGWVRNTGQRPLDDAVLAVGDDRSSVGTLPPGQRVQVHLALTGTLRATSRAPGPVTATSPLPLEQRRRQALLAAVGAADSAAGPGSVGFPGVESAAFGGARVLAFDEQPPFGVAVQGNGAREHDLTLHVVVVPVDFGSSAVRVPAGFSRRDMLENSGLSTSYYGQGVPLGTSATFQFALPPEAANTSWTALHVQVAYANASGPHLNGANVTIALYNWETGQWDAKPSFGAGTNAVPQPAPYVDERGLVRVRFTGSNGQYYLQGLEIDAGGDRR